MSALVTLREFQTALVTERADLEDVNIDKIVEERLAEIKVKVRAEVEAEISTAKLVADVKVKNIEEAIARVELAEAQAQAEAELADSDSEEPLEISEDSNGTY
jgi:hypothetical protein